MSSWLALQEARDIELIAATVMPDHVHALFVLGGRLTVGQVMAKYKVFTRDCAQEGWRWQDDGFEHRLRETEDSADYGFYIFMNPYRANLLPITKSWPWWQCPAPSRMPFLDALENGCPPQPWIGEIEHLASRITAGE